MTAQQKIEIETNAVKIIEVLLQFQKNYTWTNVLLSEMCSLSLASVETALCWLLNKSYIERRLNEYAVTDEGLEYFRGILDRSETTRESDVIQFRDECLTGLIEIRSRRSRSMVSRESEILRAVLPRNQSNDYYSEEKEISLISLKHSLEKVFAKICEQYNLTDKQFEKYCEEGRGRPCTNGDKNHIGIFDKKKDGYQSLCRECNKKKKKGIRSDEKTEV
jgi:hypothetical protein